MINLWGQDLRANMNGLDLVMTRKLNSFIFTRKVSALMI